MKEHNSFTDLGKTWQQRNRTVILFESLLLQCDTSMSASLCLHGVVNFLCLHGPESNLFLNVKWYRVQKLPSFTNTSPDVVYFHAVQDSL